MAIRDVPDFPLRSSGLSQDAYSTGVENSLTALIGAFDDFNAAATVAQLSTTTTSSSSVAIGTGAKTFTVPSGLGFVVGMTLRIANSSTAYMTGDVTSYSSTTLVVNVTSVVGSGTLASWTISQAAVGANTAGAVSFTPAGNIAATNVQSAIQELDTEKLSSAAGAVTGTNLEDITTAETVGSSYLIPVVTFDVNGRATSKSTAQKIVGGTAINTTSGTSHDYPSIPSGVKRIIMLVVGVSTNGTSVLQAQLGTSGGFVSTGYTGVSDSQTSGGGSATSLTSGLGLERSGIASASSVRGGRLVIENIVGTNTWVMTYQGYIATSGTFTTWGTATITLGAALDRIRLTTVNGTDTFDAGSINILLE